MINTSNGLFYTWAPNCKQAIDQVVVSIQEHFFTSYDIIIRSVYNKTFESTENISKYKTSFKTKHKVNAQHFIKKLTIQDLKQFDIY